MITAYSVLKTILESLIYEEMSVQEIEDKIFRGDELQIMSRHNVFIGSVMDRSGLSLVHNDKIYAKFDSAKFKRFILNHLSIGDWFKLNGTEIFIRA